MFQRKAREEQIVRCAFCGRKAMSQSYLQPPVCEKHYAVTVIASLLRSCGRHPSVKGIRDFLEHYPPRRTMVIPDEVEELCRSVPGIEG